ncbi:MAG: hypothetical protein GEU99_15620 [Luteitalea sp.]|nr:hypothetical protein [Luteitalea sp.]
MTSPRSCCHRSEGVLGMLLVLGGLLWLLVVVGVIQTERVWAYWPGLFTVVGVFRLLSGKRAQVIAGLWWIALSLLLLDVSAGLFGYELVKAAPILLMLAGATLLWRSRRSTEPQALRDGRPEQDEDLSFVAVFGNAERTVASQRFRRGDVTAIFGGCDLDFRPAHIEGEAEINVFACFGGVTISVPETWTVVSHGSAVLGSIEVDAERGVAEGTEPGDTDANAPRLILRGTTILGSVYVSSSESWWRQRRMHREAMRARALERAHEHVERKG